MSSGFTMLLARHPPVRDGQDRCYGRRDMSLAEGWDRYVADWSGEGPVFCSPASRCRIPAEKLRENGIAMRCEDTRLLEMDFGRWEGKLWSDIARSELDAWALNPFGYRPGGGEAVTDLVTRVTSFWQDRMRAAVSCRIVTHGGPLRVMLALSENRVFCMKDPAPPQGHACLLHFFNNSDGFVVQKPQIR